MWIIALIAVAVLVSLFGNDSKAEQVELGKTDETMPCGCVVRFVTKRTKYGYESQSRGYVWRCAADQAMENRLVEMERMNRGYGPRRKKKPSL